MNITLSIFFSIRAVDFDGVKSNWYGPLAIQIQSFCLPPSDIVFSIYTDGLGLSWEAFDNDFGAGYSQIEYSLQGFTPGNGSTIETGQNYTILNVEKGKAYDAYVRVYCSNNLGWSDWVGPASYFYE